MERAQLDFDGALDLDLGDQAGRKRIDAHFSAGPRAARNLYAHVVATLVQRDNLGVLPLVSELLAVGQVARLGPREQSCYRPRNVIALVRAVHADVGYAARREITQITRETIGDLSAPQPPGASGQSLDADAS